jgi:hypothetical protein
MNGEAFIISEFLEKERFIEVRRKHVESNCAQKRKRVAEQLHSQRKHLFL